VPHLSYLGDAEVGDESNIGAGNITANYDGARKHRTTIGARVHTSCDTVFVAPVTIGDDAYTGAGSVITDDVPPGALGIARSRQTTIEGYAERAPGRGAPDG
jgi:bifunctional UDP-N-acetylglucosamine pyrophosphorylase/glucosamine-1-phosphate N-acetyltransferase